MAWDRKSRSSRKPSIKYKCDPLNAASLELVDFDIKDHISTSDKNKKESSTPGVRSSEIYSTRDLISSIGYIWDRATCPFSVLLPKSGCRYDDGYVRKRNVLGYSVEERRFSERVSGAKQIHPVNLISNSYLQPLRHLNRKAMDNVLSSEPSDGTYPLVKRFLQDNLGIPYACLKDISSLEIPFDLEKVYWWPSMIALANSEHLVNFASVKKHKDGRVISDPANCHVSQDNSYDADNLMGENVSSKTNNTKLGVLSSGQNQGHPTYVRVSDTSGICEHITEDSKACTSQFPNSKQCSDSAVNILSSCNNGSEGNESSVEPEVLEKKNMQKEFIVKDISEDGNFLPLKEKPHHFLANQKHAFAGAMAGIFVSTCLHPVDTIKTVFQSCRTNKKSSLVSISRSIISERGIFLIISHIEVFFLLKKNVCTSRGSRWESGIVGGWR